MKRETFLDVAKGIGIIMVVLIHSATINGIVVTVINEFYMPMFFLITGYLYGNKYGGENDVVAKRSLMKYVTYYFYGCIILFFARVLYAICTDYSAMPGQSSVYSLFYGRYYDGGNSLIVDVFWSGHFWFLSAMVTSYVLFYFLVKAEQKGMKKEFSLGLIYVIYAYLLKMTPILLPWCIDVAPVISIIMYTGYKMGKRSWLSSKLNFKIGVMELLSVIICWRLLDTYDLHMRNYGSDMSILAVFKVVAVGVAGSVLMIRVARLIDKIPYVGKVFSYLGKNSLTIFMWHIIWIFAMNIVFSKVIIANVVIKGFIMAGSVVTLSLFTQKILDVLQEKSIKLVKLIFNKS